jgi:hypothetical protein
MVLAQTDAHSMWYETPSHTSILAPGSPATPHRRHGCGFPSRVVSLSAGRGTQRALQKETTDSRQLRSSERTR